MKKTDTMFVIHNYNTIPKKLLEYTTNYVIYDCSDDANVKKSIHDECLNVIDVDNTGHNITSYFLYFVENYDNLPDVMCLLKGNILERHCSKDFFDRVYCNKYFTYLYEDKNVKLKKNVNSLLMENQYLEINNSWYVESKRHPHKYFDNYNMLLKFIYKEPVIPEYCIFSPGACYIVLKDQVLKHTKEFYSNLNKIMNYELNPSFPSEAHQIERMLPIIFEACYEENPWMNSSADFDSKLIDCENIVHKRVEERELKNKYKNKICSIVEKLKR